MARKGQLRAIAARDGHAGFDPTRNPAAIGSFAPMNEPARAGGEQASRSAQFRRGDAE